MDFFQSYLEWNEDDEMRQARLTDRKQHSGGQKSMTVKNI